MENIVYQVYDIWPFYCVQYYTAWIDVSLYHSQLVLINFL